MDKYNERIAQAYIKRFYSMSDEKNAIYEKQKIEYAIVLILSQGEKLIIIFICAALLGMFKESLIIFATIFLTRRYLGGTHENGYFSCLMHSLCFFLCALLTGKYIPIDTFWIIPVFIIHIIMIICFAPIPSKQKPFFSRERRMKIKKKSLAGALTLFIMTNMLREHMGYIMWTLLITELDALIALEKGCGKMKKITETINNRLANMAEDLVCKTGTGLLWGETKIPECLREKVEEVESSEGQ